MNESKHIPYLLQIASDIVNPVRCFRLAAGVVYKNQIMGLGVNRWKTDPLQAKYSKHEEAIYLHSEVAAIKNSLRNLSVADLSKCNLIVVRAKKNHLSGLYEYGSSKPCSGCLRCIREFNLKKITYFNEDSVIESIT
jgi:tRNA(Arg) A34 adenosine deaminase TadA